MLDAQSSISVSPDGTLSEPLVRPGCAEIIDASGRRVALCAIDIMPEWTACEPTDRTSVEQRIAAAVPARVVVGSAPELRTAMEEWRGAGVAGNAAAADGAPVVERGISLAWVAFALAIALALGEMAVGRAASHVGAVAAPARRVT